ncbi:MAG: hypothetical protein Q8O12_06575, partial [Candidatus Omnitrophota bacterium]|nr:hypothetical protein [Candidatus Omnitrophota bacterium]
MIKFKKHLISKIIILALSISIFMDGVLYAYPVCYEGALRAPFFSQGKNGDRSITAGREIERRDLNSESTGKKDVSVNKDVRRDLDKWLLVAGIPVALALLLFIKGDYNNLRPIEDKPRNNSVSSGILKGMRDTSAGNILTRARKGNTKDISIILNADYPGKTFLLETMIDDLTIDSLRNRAKAGDMEALQTLIDLAKAGVHKAVIALSMLTAPDTGSVIAEEALRTLDTKQLRAKAEQGDVRAIWSLGALAAHKNMAAFYDLIDLARLYKNTEAVKSLANLIEDISGLDPSVIENIKDVLRNFDATLLLEDPSVYDNYLILYALDRLANYGNISAKYILYSWDPASTIEAIKSGNVMSSGVLGIFIKNNNIAAYNGAIDLANSDDVYVKSIIINLLNDIADSNSAFASRARDYLSNFDITPLMGQEKDAIDTMTVLANNGNRAAFFWVLDELLKTGTIGDILGLLRNLDNNPSAKNLLQGFDRKYVDLLNIHAAQGDISAINALGILARNGSIAAANNLIDLTGPGNVNRNTATLVNVFDAISNIGDPVFIEKFFSQLRTQAEQADTAAISALEAIAKRGSDVSSQTLRDLALTQKLAADAYKRICSDIVAKDLNGLSGADLQRGL